jgi:hypothetical protein
VLKAAQDLEWMLRERHEQVYLKIKELKELASKQGDIKELTDIAYALHECEKFLDAEEKECRNFRETLERVIGALWAKIGNPEPVRTAHVTASPDIKIMVPMPDRRREPEAYQKLMRSMKVPEELWVAGEGDNEHSVVKPHWPGMVEYVSQLASRGLPLPDGLDPSKTMSIYKLRYRGKKEVSFTE